MLVRSKFLHLFIIQFFSLFASANETLSTNKEEYASEAQISSNVTTSQCLQVENDLRAAILKKLEKAQSRVQDSIQCLSVRAGKSPKCDAISGAYLNSAKEYRNSLGSFYQEIATEWAKNKIQTTGEYARSCLLNSKGNIEQTQNIRILKNQNSQNPMLCKNLIDSFSKELNNEMLSYFRGEKTLPGRSPEDIKAIQQFAQTPYVGLIPDSIKFQANVSDQSIRSGILSAMQKVSKSMASLNENLKGLKDSDLYVLYDFGNFFENYTQSNPQGALAIQCKNKSTLLKDCRPFRLNMTVKSRCLKRQFQFIQEVFPVLPTVTAMLGLENNLGAESAGILTREEGVARKSDLYIKGLFGLTGIGTILAKPVARMTAAGVRSTKRIVRRARGTSRSETQRAPMVQETFRAASSLPAGSSERAVAEEINEMTRGFWGTLLDETKGMSGGLARRAMVYLRKAGIGKEESDQFVKECVIKSRSFFDNFIFNKAYAATTDRQARCVAWIEELYTKLYEPNKGMYDDLQGLTNYPYYGRTRSLIEATDSKVIDSLFSGPSGITKSDLDEMFFLSMADDKMSSQQREMMVELKHMVDDMPDLFWPTDGSLPSYNARMLMRKMDSERGFTDDPAVAAKMTEQALRSTEIETLARALGETFAGKKYANSKWYDRFVRFFLPHHKRVVNVLETNNALRQQLQLSHRRNEPVIDALSSEIPLTLAEKQALQDVTGKASTAVAGIRKEIAEIYGREVSQTNPLREADIRIRDISKRANSEAESRDFNALVRESETDMDTLETTMNGASRRQGGERWDLADRHNTYYQIRNPQLTRETGTNTQRYLASTAEHPHNSSYGVTKRWTVTVHHQKWETRQVTRDGKQETERYLKTWTSSYTREADDTLKARVEEVLTEVVTPRVSELSPLPTAQTRGMHAVSASNGTPRIVWQDTSRQQEIIRVGRYARAKENPHRDAIDSAITQISRVDQAYYNDLLANPTRLDAEIASLREMREGLARNANQVQRYSQWTDDRIVRNYPDDRPENFRSRNQRLHQRLTHMIRRSEHLEEQLGRRDPNLQIAYELAEYPEQIAQLAARARRNRYIQAGTGTATGLSVGAGGYYYYDDPRRARQKIQNGRDAIVEKFNLLRSTFLGTSNDMLNQ